MTKTPVLLGFIAGDQAHTMEKLDDRGATALALSTLRQMFGSKVPEPKASVRSRWANDPFALGSYSFLRVGGMSKDRGVLAEPVADRLFFAGEATSRNYPSTVHGAYTSGLREADRILNHPSSISGSTKAGARRKWMRRR